MLMWVQFLYIVLYWKCGKTGLLDLDTADIIWTESKLVSPFSKNIGYWSDTWVSKQILHRLSMLM